MAIGIFYPTVISDSGYWTTTSFNGGMTIFGLDVSSYNSFFRFADITIPQGAIINSAFVRLTARTSNSGITVNTNTYFNDIDNAVAPTTKEEAAALSLTAPIAWNNVVAFTAGVQYDSPSISSILQTVIHRAGWNSSNALQVLIKNNGSSAAAVRVISDAIYSSGTQKPELHVTWTEPTSGDISVNIPLITAEGLTGIDARSVTNPFMSVSGLTGIDARDVTIPSMTAEGFTGIYSAPSIPMQTVIMTGSDNMVHTESFITIPSMSVEITQAKQIWGNISAPMMTAEITERETVLSDVTVPMMTVELSSGVHADLEVTAPMMTSEGTFSGQCEVTLPMMTAEIEGIIGRVISSDISLPMMTVEMEGKTEYLADCDVPTPMIRVDAELITGKIITGAVTLPMMEAALTSYEEITGDINVSVPMPEAYMIGTTERAACTVLRYLEPDL